MGSVMLIEKSRVQCGSNEVFISVDEQLVINHGSIKITP